MKKWLFVNNTAEVCLKKEVYFQPQKECSIVLKDREKVNSKMAELVAYEDISAKMTKLVRRLPKK